MKRSKMVKILETHLEEGFGISYAFYEARLILTILEDAGMLPPSIKKWTEPSIISTSCKWEPEDEEERDDRINE